MAGLLWVCLGGAIGSGARYLVSGWVLRWLGPQFAWGTLAVNLLGSYLLAAVMYVGLTTDTLSPTARLLLTTGVLGGFTTYSTFNYETLRYLQVGAWNLALWNVGTTVLGCLVAGFLGFATGRWIAGA